VIEARGTCGTALRPVDAWVTVPDPVAWFGAALQTALSEEGMRIAGARRPLEDLPAGAWERIAAHRSGSSISCGGQQAEPELLRREPAQDPGGRALREGTWPSGIEGWPSSWRGRWGCRGRVPHGRRLRNVPSATASRPPSSCASSGTCTITAGGGLRPVPALLGRARALLGAPARAEPYRDNVYAKTGRSRGSRPSRATPRGAPASSTPSRSWATARAAPVQARAPRTASSAPSSTTAIRRSMTPPATATPRLTTGN
jgi:hypothetical protein